jgi:hypothetical protein
MLLLRFAGGEPPSLSSGTEINRWTSDNGEAFAFAFRCDTLRVIAWPGLALFSFSAGSREVEVWPESSADRRKIFETFRRVLQPVILEALGEQVLHAGAAVGSRGLVAFCGNSGSGKSTLSYAMQMVGWRQVSDDALLVRIDDSEVRADALPFAPRLRTDALAHFSRNQLLHEEAPTSPVQGLSLAAIFLLEQDSAAPFPAITGLPQARAFPRLLAHAHCFDPTDLSHLRRVTDEYLRLVQRVPVFILQFPPTFETLPQLVRFISSSVHELQAADRIDGS